MGCRKGKSFEELKSFVSEKLKETGIDERSLKAIVSVDKKKDEEGLLELSKAYKIPFLTYSPQTLMEQVGDFEHSDKVMEVIGADNVCERAVAAYGCKKFVLKKTSQNGMTLAIGMTDTIIEA
jgi:cobalt-precorrin 5A hydrolase